MSSDPLQNLPSTTTAFTNTSGPRRLLSSSSSSTKRVVTSTVFTSSTETPEVLLLAGRDPECRQRVRFNGTQVRLRFLEEARGINVGKEEKGKEREGKGVKKVVVEDRQDVREGGREQRDERPRKRPKKTGGGEEHKLKRNTQAC
ncbi:hypothetical protein K440DRAFT_623013, partial [Wilcoxina mikolae CBS 423.85]